MPKIDFTKSKTYVIIAGFATILPVITYFGIPIPKVAWAQDLLGLEKEQLETKIELYRRELSRQRYESLKLEREIDQVERDEGTIPDNYLKEQEYLNSDIEELSQEIEKASERLVEIK